MRALLAFLILAPAGCASAEMKADAAYHEPAPYPATGGRARTQALAPTGVATDDAALEQREGEAKPQPRPEPTEPEPVAEPQQRLVIYTADLAVKVPSVDEAKAAFLALVEELGGYLARQDGDRLSARVPAAAFEEAVSAVKDLGQTVRERLSADDVTRQAFELDIRIENARRSRQRLLELLEQGGDIETVLKIEKELRRVTEELELLKSKRRTLADQVAMSTLTVEFLSHAPAPQPPPGARRSPFAWVNQVGPTRLRAMPTWDDEGCLFRSGLALPERFLVLYDCPDELRALSAEGTRVRYRRFAVTGADLGFWREALLEHFRENRGLTSTTAREVRAGQAQELVVETRVQGEKVRYLLVLEVEDGFFGREVVVTELLAEDEAFPEAAAALREALSIDAPPEER